MMKSEQELTEKIEAYINGELSPAAKMEFEQMRAADPVIDQKVVEHQLFLKNIQQYGRRTKLVSSMNKIHQEIDVQSLVPATENSVPAKIVKMWRVNRANTAVAASVAIVAVLLTLLSTGYFSHKVSSGIEPLKRDIFTLKRSQNAIMKNINGKNATQIGPGHYGGTGFALSSDGYILTNYHVVEGADSVYVQNAEGASFKAKPVYTDPAYDLAVLQITDSSFSSKTLPYTFKKSVSDLGEDVYTYGFPGDAGVYNKGYVSSLTGYSGDTLAYRIDIPLNPGNSGGPLLDNKGNIIGIVTGKQTQADGVYFAVKSNYLLKSLELIPEENLDKKIIINKKNNLSGLSRQEQIKRLQDFVYMVKAY